MWGISHVPHAFRPILTVASFCFEGMPRAQSLTFSALQRDRRRDALDNDRAFSCRILDGLDGAWDDVSQERGAVDVFRKRNAAPGTRLLGLPGVC